LLEAELYRISAIRSNFEQNNLSIAESFLSVRFIFNAMVTLRDGQRASRLSGHSACGCPALLLTLN
jgi:hypothetical protein